MTVTSGGSRSDTRTDTDVVTPDGTGSGRLSFGATLAIIAILGLIGRVVYLLLVRDTPIYSDSLGYHYRALLLADGDGYILPLKDVLGINVKPVADATIPPGWFTFLALPSWLGLRSVLSHQLIAGFVGAGTIVMTGLAGKAAFGRRTGLIAAAIVAVYPNIWIYERELMVEPLAMLLIATTIWLAYTFLARPGPWLAFALGVTIGALALTRSEQIALLVFLVLPLIAFRRSFSWQRRVAWLALAGLGVALFVVPWAAYNTTRFERPVLLSNGLGGAMRAGNCEPVYHGDLIGHYKVTFQPGKKDGCSILDKKFSTDQSVSDSQLRHAALDFMSHNVSRVPIVVAARLGRTFNVFKPFQQVHFEAERKSSVWVPRLGLFAYWLLVPFAVVGVVAARRRKIKIYPLLVSFGLVVLSVSLTIGAVRYRAPAEISLVLLAAFGIQAVWNRWTHRAAAPRRDAEPVPASAPVGS